jgi:hypothetical protein
LVDMSTDYQHVAHRVFQALPPQRKPTFRTIIDSSFRLERLKLPPLLFLTLNISSIVGLWLFIRLFFGVGWSFLTNFPIILFVFEHPIIELICIGIRSVTELAASYLVIFMLGTRRR